MNERIRNLAEKAGILITDVGAFHNHERGWGAYQLKEQHMEKFAELIVRECAKVAKLTETDDGDDYKSGRQWAGIDVLKHFGVEE